MANTFVQQVASTNRTTASSLALAYSGNVTFGNILIVCFRYNASSGQTLTNITCNRVTGNLSIVYDIADGTTVHGVLAWGLANGTGAATVTATMSASTAGLSFALTEYNGPTALRTNPAAVASGGAVTSLQTNSLTAQTGDLLISTAECANPGVAAPSIDSGFTIRSVAVSASQALDEGIADILSPSAGAIAPTWTQTSSISSMSVGIAAFANATVIGQVGAFLVGP